MIEHAGDVIRIRWPCILRGMARIAVCIHQLIISAGMACLTGCRHMRSGQGELCRAVVEGRGFPHHCRVAGLADMTETSRNVIRVYWHDKVCCMACITISVDQPVVAVHMARLARRRRVRPGQRELRRTVGEG
jgi:hypothetical protein